MVVNISWFCLQRMVPSATSDRANEKFVQWRQPVESRGKELHDEGDASTSRGKKKKQQRRVRNAHGEPETSIQGLRGDESGQGGSPIAIVSKGGRGTSSPIAGEVPSGNPPSGFKPPRQLLNIRSNRRIPRATEPPKAPEHTQSMVHEDINSMSLPKEAIQDKRQSPAVASGGTAA